MNRPGPIVTTLIENVYDLHAAQENLIAPELVRRMEVTDARVDVTLGTMAMPGSLINRLGLCWLRPSRERAIPGMRPGRSFGPAKLTVQGRDCVIEVSELAEGCPVLIGFIPLEMLDFVVDPRGRRLIGNPEHGGEWMFDMFLQTSDNP